MVLEPEVVLSTADALRSNFPFDVIRPTQDKALTCIGSAYDNDNPFVIMELPCGSGKSPLGVATARFAGESKSKDAQPGAYILTSQKSLQSQMVADFSHLGLVELRGRGNYTCEKNNTDCETATSALGACQDCPYKQAKADFISAKMGVTNYSYLMHEALHSGQLPRRAYLIADEAHNIEKEVLGLSEIRITPNRCEEIGCPVPPRYEGGSEAEVVEWLEKNFVTRLSAEISKLRVEMSDFRGDMGQAASATAKRLNLLDGILTRVKMFTGCLNPEEWLAWTDDDKNLLIKPLHAALFAKDCLFQMGEKNLLMSATILDFGTTRRNLGIADHECRSFRARSEFPVETRPIVFWPSGSMSFRNAETTIPTVLNRTATLLQKRFANVKGIIHTHTYKLAHRLAEHLQSIPELRHRVLVHTNLPGDRDRVLAEHFTSPLPTVLISPSMTEGLDLKGDLSRFNIILKVPYPYLDPYNRVRKERDPSWYALQTALVMIQASGRSNRSADDEATTVILDSDFGGFMDRNESILPAWWREAVRTK